MSVQGMLDTCIMGSADWWMAFGLIGQTAMLRGDSTIRNYNDDIPELAAQESESAYGQHRMRRSIRPALLPRSVEQPRVRNAGKHFTRP